jgi:hypothetical protein
MSSSKPDLPKNQSNAAPKPADNSGQADRLAAALRDNLKRRKAQARARHQTAAGRREG